MKIQERIKKINYKEMILKTIAVSAVLSVALLAPNALKMFDLLKNNGLAKKKIYIRNKLSSLVHAGYIIVEKTNNGKQFLSLTSKGRLELSKYLNVSFKKPKKWDGFWTVVIFDVPHARKGLRDILRFRLKRLGFTQLQKSVWVFPYECEEIVMLLKTNFKMGKEVIYMRVKRIENDKLIRKHFNLE